MAHEIEHDECTQQETSITDNSVDARHKSLLNRREYIRLGGAAVATGLGIRAGLVGTSSSQATQTDAFATDFSEYAQ